MEVIGIPDGQARLQALLGGQIDMERGITAQQAPMLSGSDDFPDPGNPHRQLARPGVPDGYRAL